MSNQFVIPLASRPLERALLFPMAVVHNAWGTGNMLYLRVQRRARISIGLFGALLVVLLIPGGIALAAVFDTFTTQWNARCRCSPWGWLFTTWPGSTGEIPERGDGNRLNLLRPVATSRPQFQGPRDVPADLTGETGSPDRGVVSVNPHVNSVPDADQFGEQLRSAVGLESTTIEDVLHLVVRSQALQAAANPP